MSPLFSRRKNKKNSDTEPAPNARNQAAPAEPMWQENPLYDAQETYDQTSSVHTQLSGLYADLTASKKGGSGLFRNNSDYYNAVSSGLSNVLSTMGLSLGEDMDSIQQVFAQVQQAYEKLTVACQAYLKRRSFTSLGQARQDIVGQILEQAKEDMATLVTYSGQHLALPKADQATNVGQALGIARRKKLTMKKADSEYQHVGGAASRLTVLEEGDLQDTDMSGFFKEQDIFTFHHNNKYGVLEQMEQARRFISISDALYEKARKAVVDKIPDTYESTADQYLTSMSNIITLLEALPETSTDPVFYDYIQLVGKMSRSWDITKDHMNLKYNLNIRLKEGDTLNLTNRNVATSRVAEILGLGDLIAKSETVEMKEPGQKKGRIGNLMQKAQGREAAKIAAEYQTKTLEQRETASDPQSIKNLMSQKITGNFQKQLVSLQVLDFITGQIDRHANNYLIQEDANTGMLTGLTGIDNDFSFGNTTVGERGIIGTNGRSVVNNDGKLSIPHMDKALAERVLALNKDQLTFLLADLLEPDAIQGACKRLDILQQAIRTEERADAFLTDTQWNEQTLDTFRNQKGGWRNLAGDGTYLGILLSTEEESSLATFKNNLKTKKASQNNIRQAASMWDQLTSMGILNTPEMIYHFLEKHLTGSSETLKAAKILYKRGALKPNMAFQELPKDIQQLLATNMLIQKEKATQSSQEEGL